MAALGAKLRSRIVGLFSMDYIGHVCVQLAGCTVTPID